MDNKTLKFKKSRGITLIELLIYLAITAIVLVVIIDLVTRVAQNKSSTAGQEEISSNGRLVMERLTYAVQSASSIDGAYPADNLDLTINGTAVSFSLSDGQIFYAEGFGAPTALINSKVEVLPPAGENIFNKVANDPAQTVQIKFKIRFKQNNLTRDFQTSLLARNK